MKFTDMTDEDPKDWSVSDISTSAAWFSPQEVQAIPSSIEGVPNPSSEFHGIFVPYIPYQAIKRFTKVGELVWDCFAGTGTTHHVANVLDRRCICTDINPLYEFIIGADSAKYIPEENVQLVIMHPPYFNIVDYGDGLSSTESLAHFLDSFQYLAGNVAKFLDDDRMLVLVCGNIWLEGEEITLGCLCKDIIRDLGFRLRSHIVKGYGETKGGGRGKNANLMRYRHMKNGMNAFYGDNVFYLQKHPSKMRRME